VKTKLLLLFVPFLLGGCGSQATQQASVGAPGVLVEDAWVRATTGAKDATMTAAFM
jgi:copper(I)-binding protein